MINGDDYLSVAENWRYISDGIILIADNMAYTTRDRFIQIILALGTCLSVTEWLEWRAKFSTANHLFEGDDKIQKETCVAEDAVW